MAQSLVDVALEYAALGWHLLPGAKKIPFLSWDQASNDPIAVTKMFERWPAAEILVLCGPSKLAVLDLDLYKGTWDDMPLLPYTWEAETPRGGRQLIFADPDSVVPTTAGRLHASVDTRGVGGLIVLPGPNSPGRRWRTRTPKPAVWPVEDFPTLGTPFHTAPTHTDANGTWVPVLSAAERYPNEDCPGAYHLETGRQPRLGVRKMPDGTYRAMCWSGCEQSEIIPLLIKSGRFTAEELGIVTPASATRFISRDELMALEPPVWMIEPFVQTNALIMLAAKFNTGKTFVAVEWASRLSVEGKKVLYVALEGLNGLQSRIKAWEEHNKQAVGSLRFSPRGYSLNLLSDASVSSFVRDVEAEGSFDLIVVDNLGEAMPGDENDSETVARAMFALNQIRHASGGAVLDLHNSGHGGTVRARGHSKMLDVHDTVVYLESIEGSINGLKVVSGKERNAERFVTRRAQLKPVADSLVAVMGGKAVAEANPIYTAVKLGHDTVNKIAKSLDIPPTTVRYKVKELVDSGDLSTLSIGKETTYHCIWDAVL